ncbi:DNA (cytosine-5-)-methyltransferase [Bacillus anthracis]|nr:DNA (cytosine-5-)-methyltransferase [Bacillus anthracis]
MCFHVIIHLEVILRSIFMKQNHYKVIDLFAGAGGMSLGFEKAGFKVELAVEKDQWAADTYNFNRECSHMMVEDITNLDNTFFKQYQGIDLIIGGPPCQGFSIAASNRRKENDDRNELYREFLRAITVIKPKVVFMENVKEIIKFKNKDGLFILEDIKDTLSNIGYKVHFEIVNAANYGIPQERLRFFLLAILDYEGEINFSDFQTHSSEESLITQKVLTVWDAISDLPCVEPGKVPEDAYFHYDVNASNDYQKSLRSEGLSIYNHVPMRHTSRTIEKFKLIKSKNENNIPDELKPRVRGNAKEISQKTYSQNHRRIEIAKPSPTITASFYSSFIHPVQHRNLTVREAARIQTFPDHYRFLGKRTTLSKKLLEKKGIFEDLHLDQFNQVGNAVPPLLAQKFAEYILNILQKKVKETC